MENHTVLGKLEKIILCHLATHPNSLKLQVKKELKRDYKSINISIASLIKKGLVEKGEKVTSEKGAKYPGYKISERGLYYMLAYNGADFEKILQVNDIGKQFLQIWGPALNDFKDKTIKKKIIKTAVQLALTFNTGADNIEVIIYGMAGLATLFNSFTVAEKKAFFSVLQNKEGPLGKAYQIMQTLTPAKQNIVLVEPKIIGGAN